MIIIRHIIFIYLSHSQRSITNVAVISQSAAVCVGLSFVARGHCCAVYATAAVP